MKIPTFVWIGLILLLGGGLLVVLVANKNNSKAIVPTSGLPVQVEVYSDYNCPHCASFVPYVNEVQDTFGVQVNIIKKHAPILGATSFSYAYAAEAARLQNKFDEFDLALFKWIVFKNDPESITFTYSDEEKDFYTNSINVTTLAERLGLDVAQFENDRKSSSTINKVQAEKSELTERVINVGTPAVFIYGQEFQMQALEDLKTKVQELISQNINQSNEAK